MKTLPPCDHDECGITECTRTADAQRRRLERVVGCLRELQTEIRQLEAEAEKTTPTLYWACYHRCGNKLEDAIGDLEVIQSKASNDPSSATGAGK